MITLTPLAELSADDVAANRAEVIQRVQEDNPSLDVRRGVFADLLAYYHAALATQQQDFINRYNLGGSPAQIVVNPLTADPDLVNAILSNFGITRKTGTTATGTITVVVSADTTVTIGNGSTWMANGQTFSTSAVFTAKVNPAQINSETDRLLVATLDGNWSFTIDVTAVNTGPQANLANDTTITPDNPPNNFVRAFAADSFSGGMADETNQQLLDRLQFGVAAKTFGNRVTMQAMLLALPEYASIGNMSIVGFGDAEMLRDRHWILPVSGGGRIDWYVRTQEQVLGQVLLKTATLIAITGSVGTWQFSLSKTDAPGYFEVTNIRLANSGNTIGSFPIVTDTRSLDLTGDGFLPDLATTVEGVYSCYQAGVIQFEDTVTDASSLAIGATKNYTIEARCLPLLADLQTFVNARANRNVAGDCLIKAPVPCFVSISLTINMPSTTTVPDLNAIKTAVCEAINTTGFTGKLFASNIHGAVNPYLSAGQSVSNMDLLGRLRYPDGSSVALHDAEVLTVPAAPASMVSANTVQFFSTETDVAIAVVTL